MKCMISIEGYREATAGGKEQSDTQTLARQCKARQGATLLRFGMQSEDRSSRRKKRRKRRKSRKRRTRVSKEQGKAKEGRRGGGRDGSRAETEEKR